jgi:hypothetical protein
MMHRRWTSRISDHSIAGVTRMMRESVKLRTGW